MLKVIDLNFSYEDKPLLSKVNFVVNPNTLLHLRGGNGVGKTTLLKLIAGIIGPFKGDIRYLDYSIKDNKFSFQQNISYVGHKLGLSKLLTVRENYKFSFGHGNDKDKFNESLNDFELIGYEDKALSLLSAGLQHRASLMCILKNSSPIWLLDEPFVSLDDKAILLLMEKIKFKIRQGGIVVITSHQNIDLNNLNTSINYQEYFL